MSPVDDGDLQINNYNHHFQCDLYALLTFRNVLIAFLYMLLETVKGFFLNFAAMRNIGIGIFYFTEQRIYKCDTKIKVTYIFFSTWPVGELRS